MPEDVTESAMICVTQGLPAGPVYGKTTHPAKGLALPMSNQLALIKSYKINPQKMDAMTDNLFNLKCNHSQYVETPFWHFLSF